MKRIFRELDLTIPNPIRVMESETFCKHRHTTKKSTYTVYTHPQQPSLPAQTCTVTFAYKQTSLYECTSKSVLEQCQKI